MPFKDPEYAKLHRKEYYLKNKDKWRTETLRRMAEYVERHR